MWQSLRDELMWSSKEKKTDVQPPLKVGPLISISRVEKLQRHLGLLWPATTATRSSLERSEKQHFNNT
jgi:hypothetical protein